jgi:rhodanese-related sulfurtransferase
VIYYKIKFDILFIPSRFCIKYKKEISMQRNCLSVLLGLLFVAYSAVGSLAGDYNYISQDDLQKRLQAKDAVILLDICPVEQYARGHIPGSIETNAFPAKTEEEKALLDAKLPTINASNDDVVIVCPRGGGGARNTFDFYASKGVDRKRLLILEKGMDNWPYEKDAK